MLAVFAAGFATSGALESALAGRPFLAMANAAFVAALLGSYFWGHK